MTMVLLARGLKGRLRCGGDAEADRNKASEEFEVSAEYAKWEN